MHIDWNKCITKTEKIKQTYLYRMAKKENKITATKSKPAKKKNSIETKSNICDPAIMTTIKLPNATVSNQAACMTDFIAAGACEYASHKYRNVQRVNSYEFK